MTKTSAFRSWLHNLWLDNCAERGEFKELPYTLEEYFARYKYWLKREFRHQRNR